MKFGEAWTDEEIFALQDPFERAAAWQRRARMAEGKCLAIADRGKQTSGAALFRKRKPGEFDPEVVEWSRVDDTIQFRWTKVARYAAFNGMGGAIAGDGYMRGEVYAHLPSEQQAEGWWHLCALLGIAEAYARAIYHHPEWGQKSAVAAAPPAAGRGPTIFCQGDW